MGLIPRSSAAQQTNTEQSEVGFFDTPQQAAGSFIISVEGRNTVNRIHGLQILIDTAFNPFSVQFFPEKTAQPVGHTDEDMHGYPLVCSMENRTYGQKFCIFHLLE